MTPERQTALAQKALALADDELILGHRNSEWAGHGPILEEDIAFTNIALDEMGHATIWYSLLGELTGEDPDELVFFREASGYRNIQMVELPNGDWAFSMLRQYLFDAAEMVQLAHLSRSQYAPLAEAAAKIRTEEIYHLRHTAAWTHRLGLGTAESQRRMQQALDQLWPYTAQLFAAAPDESLLVAARFAPDPAQLRPEWEAAVRPTLTAVGLQVPDGPTQPVPRRDEHTAHLTALLAEMQAVARLDPEAEW